MEYKWTSPSVTWTFTDDYLAQVGLSAEDLLDELNAGSAAAYELLVRAMGVSPESIGPSLNATE